MNDVQNDREWVTVLCIYSVMVTPKHVNMKFILSKNVILTSLYYT